MKIKRYSVLSYIINDYEILHEIGEKDPDAEYIMVTDNPDLQSKSWDVFYDESLDGLSVFDKCYAIRFNCFKYVHTNICVRVDGSMRIKHSLKLLIDKFESGAYDVCLMPHPFNDNFIDEYDLWVKVRGYPREQADRCLNSMRGKGYDFGYKGMFQGGFAIFRRNELCRKIETLTYDYLKELGSNGIIERIDQIPFSFVMNSFFSNIKVLPVSEQILRSYYIQLYEHHGMYPNMNACYDTEKPDIRYMFNEQVTCLYLDTPVNAIKSYEKEIQTEIKEICDQVKLYKRENDNRLRKERKLLRIVVLLVLLDLLIAIILIACI